MTKVILVVGVPGVGKTTLIKETLKKLDKEGINVKYINYGDLILELASKIYNISDRDQIRKKLSKEEAIYLQKLVAKNIKYKILNDEKKYDVVLIDTHLFIESPEGFYSAYVEEVSQLLVPDAIVLIEAPAEHILIRRISDKSRNRDLEDLWKIKLHQNLNEYHAAVLAHKTGCYLYFVENLNNMLENAVENLYNYMKKLLTHQSLK